VRVAVAGATGRVGRFIAEAIEAAPDLALVARIAPSLSAAGAGCYGLLGEAITHARPDVLVDFTRPDLIAAHAAIAVEAGVPLVMGTTGLTAEERDDLDVAARERGVPIFFAPNFAVTAVLMMRFAADAARLLPDCEVVEEHAATKLDRPSGTALHTADVIEAASGRRPPIHSLRLPGLVANQSVVFGSEGQTLTIRHDTTSREAFVPGVLLAVRRVHALPAGLTVGLDTLL
jgi:4-hydroxy-tetrahydrodipicolinate reductase